MRLGRKGWAAIAAAAVSAAVWLYPSLSLPYGVTIAPSSSEPAAVAGDVATLLAQVRIIDRLPVVEGYDRGCGKGEAPFGPAWNDPLDHSGCDARGY